MPAPPQVIRQFVQAIDASRHDGEDRHAAKNFHEEIALLSWISSNFCHNQYIFLRKPRSMWGMWFSMARTQARPRASRQVTLQPHQTTCRACGSQMRMGHHSHRTVTTLQGVTRLEGSLMKHAKCARASFLNRLKHGSRESAFLTLSAYR